MLFSGRGNGPDKMRTLVNRPSKKMPVHQRTAFQLFTSGMPISEHLSPSPLPRPLANLGQFATFAGRQEHLREKHYEGRSGRASDLP